MAERGLAVLPDDADLHIQYALSAHHAGHYREAVVRWQRAVGVVPHEPICHAGLATNLREMRDFDRAQVAIDEGLRRFPRDLAVLTEAARIASCRGHFQMSLSLWQKAIATPKPHPDWLQGHAQSLVAVGEFEEAEAALKAALADFPEHSGLRETEEALVAAREDQSTVAASLETEPEPLEIGIQASMTMDKMDVVGDGEQQEDPEQERGEAKPETQEAICLATAEPPPTQIVTSFAHEFSCPIVIDPIQTEEDQALKEMMLRFESIGDDCEFGFVQRRYAAEPLGLLRWNTVVYDQLLQAIGHRFKGFGDEANTHIGVGASGEFWMHDRRWSLGMRTFLYESQTNRDALFRRMCRRMTYLRDKFLSDLADAEKIFVYRSVDLDRDRLDMLHKALRTIGPVKLLAVQPAAPSSSFEGAPGHLLQVDDRRFVGILGRPGRDAFGKWNIAFDDWLSICRKAVDAM